MERKRPTNQIIEMYNQNKARLKAETDKSGDDRMTQNNIHAYKHIVQSLEAVYELT